MHAWNLCFVIVGLYSFFARNIFHFESCIFADYVSVYFQFFFLFTSSASWPLTGNSFVQFEQPASWSCFSLYSMLFLLPSWLPIHWKMMLRTYIHSGFTLAHVLKIWLAYILLNLITMLIWQYTRLTLIMPILQCQKLIFLNVSIPYQETYTNSCMRISSTYVEVECIDSPEAFTARRYQRLLHQLHSWMLIRIHILLETLLWHICAF